MRKKRGDDAGKRVSAARANSKTVARSQVQKKWSSVWRSVVSKTIYESKNRSGSITYRLLIGYDKGGKQIRTSWDTKQGAMAFQEAWNLAVEKGSEVDITILSDVAQIDVRWAVRELEKLGVSLREAVNFYLNHALPEAGFLGFEEAMDKFYDYQQEKQLAPASSSKKHTSYKTYYKPMIDHFGQKPLVEINADDVRKYLKKRGTNWGARHYNDHLNYGQRFWNALAELKYCSKEINPWAEISRKKVVAKRGSKKLMSAENVQEFFWFAEAKAQQDPTKYQEVALMALTFFCGIRIEEIEKCLWSQIQKDVPDSSEPQPDDSRWQIVVWGDQEKTSMEKVNPIPSCAKYWLAEAEKHKWCDAIPHWDHKQRMKRLRKAFRNEKGIEVPTNTGRHCFCSYHLGLYENYPLTVQRLNHGDVSTMRQNYKATVDRIEAENFFKVLPETVKDRLHDQQMSEEWDEYAEMGIFGLFEIEWFDEVKKELTRLFVEFAESKEFHEFEALEAVESKNPLKNIYGQFSLTKEMILSVYKQTSFDHVGKHFPVHKDISQLKDHLKIDPEIFFEIDPTP